MIFQINLAGGKMCIGDAIYYISNRVKTIKDGTRKSFEVIKSIPDNKPFDPMNFPIGKWHIIDLHWQPDKKFDPKTYGLVKIITDAWQLVDVWSLDEFGDYKMRTSERVRDEGYCLYYSAFSTTIRGIRIDTKEHALTIARMIQNAFAKKEKVIIEVF